VGMAAWAWESCGRTLRAACGLEFVGSYPAPRRGRRHVGARVGVSRDPRALARSSVAVVRFVMPIVQATPLTACTGRLT
jgi:hypothetical protein